MFRCIASGYIIDIIQNDNESYEISMEIDDIKYRGNSYLRPIGAKGIEQVRKLLNYIKNELYVEMTINRAFLCIPIPCTEELIVVELNRDDMKPMHKRIEKLERTSARLSDDVRYLLIRDRMTRDQMIGDQMTGDQMIGDQMIGDRLVRNRLIQSNADVPNIGNWYSSVGSMIQYIYNLSMPLFVLSDILNIFECMLPMYISPTLIPLMPLYLLPHFPRFPRGLSFPLRHFPFRFSQIIGTLYVPNHPRHFQTHGCPLSRQFGIHAVAKLFSLIRIFLKFSSFIRLLAAG